MRTYDISPLSDEGMSALLWGFGAGTARLKSPLIVCRTSRLEKAYTLREVQALRGQVTLLWAWPGQWRTEVFHTTARHVQRAWDDRRR
jgi:hypothetical protein